MDPNELEQTWGRLFKPRLTAALEPSLDTQGQTDPPDSMSIRSSEDATAHRWEVPGSSSTSRVHTHPIDRVLHAVRESQYGGLTVVTLTRRDVPLRQTKHGFPSANRRVWYEGKWLLATIDDRSQTAQSAKVWLEAQCPDEMHVMQKTLINRTTYPEVQAFELPTSIYQIMADASRLDSIYSRTGDGWVPQDASTLTLGTSFGIVAEFGSPDHADTLILKAVYVPL